jgi:hypothetical protein
MRAIYVIEFLLAVFCALYVWDVVSGDGNLDYVPWYWKLAGPVVFAGALVAATSSLVRAPQARIAPAIGWMMVCIVIAVLLAFVTRYYVAAAEKEQQEENQEKVLPLARTAKLTY